MTDLRFYLGTHRPNWLWTTHDVPLFVSHRVLKGRRKRFPRATTPWALDSGGFTELNLYGEWRTTPEEYVAAVRRYDTELGCMEWASPQDWMCEPFVLAKTGLTVAEHQRRTIENLIELRALDDTLGFIPVLQGWTVSDYLRHADAYVKAGIDLTAEPVVGIGSVCRRQASGQIANIFDRLAGLGIAMHGFGVKAAGLSLYADNLVSADSLAWSYGARQEAMRGGDPTCAKNTCANCFHAAMEWRARVLDGLDGRQMHLALYGGRRMTAYIAGPDATTQLATIAAIARTDVGGGRVKSQQEIDGDAVMEHEAEERAWDRKFRPLSLSEWARREESA